MARSRSSSALGLYNAPSNKGLSYLKAAHSTPTLRRVTRSQSRKLEAPELQNERGRAGQFSDGAASSRWGQNKGSMNGKGLDLIQESSTKTPRRSSGRPVNPIGRDSLEDAEATNISGTTILPSEPDTDFDPEMMLEALPDLERAAKNVLDLLVPASTDPVSIVNMAKKLADPKNTQSRRLSRAKSKFESESSYFGSHSYIDAEKANVLILSALENKHNGLGHDWSPDSALQRANCARFALEVLLAKAGTDAPMQAIRNVEDVFPNFFYE
ncbi:uncharacterized protein ATNIH1004_007152 [Aspergillus tanneri]|uniref:Uncharacterized protein n=1 Tax=Aspergillus tanneri TaxID=1220188 RepID=A0A5M9ML85_9EURO|nr:uncharacterized protein ATNIH1004_007152 [Aspergillus tanneri]KAA8645733.1 hypothetical protein ATNIH1004_007152 [Aspergillus tanneri]